MRDSTTLATTIPNLDWLLRTNEPVVSRSDAWFQLTTPLSKALVRIIFISIRVTVITGKSTVISTKSQVGNGGRTADEPDHVRLELSIRGVIASLLNGAVHVKTDSEYRTLSGHPKMVRMGIYSLSRFVIPLR